MDAEIAVVAAEDAEDAEGMDAVNKLDAESHVSRVQSRT